MSVTGAIAPDSVNGVITVGWFIRAVLSIPLASQASGEPVPPALAVAGQRVAVNICYEDAFGAELARWSRDATLLVNVTNDAWYGRSIGPWQHDQIAAMRAKETGRPMLRATNTGITSVIEADGSERVHLPWFRRGLLETHVTGATGDTPFMRFGDRVRIEMLDHDGRTLFGAIDQVVRRAG